VEAKTDRARVDFLTYSSRSGSTFLAKKISETFGVLMVPEHRIGFDLVLASDSAVEPAVVLERARRDEQMTWVKEADWHEFLDAGPKSPADVMRFIGEVYARDIGADTGLDQVHKLGDILHLWTHVRRHFPDAHAINLVRDGRAVVNSMLHTPYPYPRYPGEMMAQGDLWKCASIWARDIDVAQQVSTNFPGSVFTVRYEDLLADLESEMALLEGHMNWNRAPGSEFRVAQAEQRIHRLADREPQAARSEAWKVELTADQITLIEWRAGSALERLEYLEHVPGVDSCALSVARGYVKHVSTQFRSVWPRVRALGTVAEIRRSLRYRAARRRGRSDAF